MPKEIDGITYFTQEEVNEMAGKARAEGRSAGANEAQEQLAELEGIQTQYENLQDELGQYDEFVQAELEGLEGPVKTLVDKLPERLSALEKLAYAKSVDVVTEPAPGTPARPKKGDVDSQDDKRLTL